MEGLSLNKSAFSRNNEESSEDEEERKAKEVSLAERQAQAVRDREEKQRKYEERRQELFGTPSSSGNNSNTSQQHLNNTNTRSGTSTPSSLTPPGSRSATPNRGGRGKGGRGGRGPGAPGSNPSTRNQSRGSQHRELYDPSHTPKPNREDVQRIRTPDIHPIRAPRGPDGTGRGGFGFSSPRGGHMSNEYQVHAPANAVTTSFNTAI